MSANTKEPSNPGKGTQTSHSQNRRAEKTRVQANQREGRSEGIGKKSVGEGIRV